MNREDKISALRDAEYDEIFDCFAGFTAENIGGMPDNIIDVLYEYHEAVETAGRQWYETRMDHRVWIQTENGQEARNRLKVLGEKVFEAIAPLLTP